jgi:hypothetical protein
MAKNILSENTGIRKKYTLWRQKRNVWVTQNKTFVSGAHPTDRVDEYASYSRTAKFIGFTVLVCALLQFFFSDILPLILNAMPLNFGYDSWNRTFWGDTSVIYVISAAAGIAVYGFIIFAVFVIAKLPKKLLFTRKIRSKAFLKAAFPASLSLAVLYISAVRLFGGTFRMPAPDIPIALQAVFAILVMPILCEFAFRGALLFHLRQYGDLAALISVSVIISLLGLDIRLIPATFLVSAVLCYFSLAAENVIVPIMMHIVMNIVIRIYVILKSYEVSELVMYILFAVCLAAGIAAAFYLLAAHHDEVETESSDDPLPSREKFFCMITSVPVIVAITFILILGYL